MMKRRFGIFVFLSALVLQFSPTAFAVTGNAWHIPDSTELGSPVRMRFEEFFFGPNGSFDVYNGNQFTGPGNAGDQSGGSVFFKGVSENLAVGSWHSAPLNFYKPIGNNKYWKATINTTGISGSDPILYYLRITYADGHEPTFLYGSDAASNASASETTAAGSPFSVRNRAAFIFHANNRVVLPGADVNHNDVQFWAKIGHINRDTAGTQWTDHACVYYTVDGSAPAGALGVGTGTTQVAVMHYDHEENDPSPAGNAMWWFGTAANLPNFNIQPANTPIRYKIGVWNSSNNEEKFADYNAGTNAAIFSFNIGTIGDPNLTVNGVTGDYTTTHLFVDEVAGDSLPVTMIFSPNVANVTSVEVYSNLNRRDRATLDANGDGIEDGIVPPDGNLLVAGDDNNYYKAYPMNATGTPGQYSLTLNAQKTGAYRLTARYKVTGNPTWFWYSSNGRRDHCIVVSPKKARDITLYELNTINIESQGTQDTQRSTFVDLWDGPGARPYNAVTARFNLSYLQNLGVNWLWFQPIHPQGIDGRQIDPDTGQPYEVGSPYAVKNFFEVMPLMSKANTRAAAMTEFADFVAAADGAGVNVMLDAPFNHTAYDAELAASGVSYFSPAANATDEIRNKEARFYSRTDAYDMRASSAGNVAVAPDRYDFGKFGDTHDVYFGRYAALVPNSSQQGNYLNEGDWFDYTIGSENSAGTNNGHFDGVTQNVWKYFSDYILYWLDKTGCPAGTPANMTYKGIDGLRADFGQGLPPQCWEYIINKARSRKWNFVFMTESLDGGAVTYRSNRHFDVLNENIVFALKSAANTSDYRNIFEGRRDAYGQGLVLLNSTSHDEESMDDPFQSLIRYGVCSSIDGAPMLFYGQELGLSRVFGFDRYELNFGKQIPHFKKYNSLQPLFAPGNRNFGLDQLYPLYSAINEGRKFSAALRSSNRNFLYQTGDGSTQPSIFSVAKYQSANVSPGQSDVVFAFVNLDRNNTQTGNFNVTVAQNGSNLFGISSTRTYNAKNIAAYTGQDPNRRNAWLWNGTAGFSGQTILQNGLFVSLNPVPGTNAGWTSNPYEAQYLKVYDISAPNTPAPGPQISNIYGYSLTNSITFNWSADPNVNPSYTVTVTVNGGTPFTVTTTSTSYTYTGAYGDQVTITVRATNPDSAANSGTSSGATVKLLNPAGDEDGDGMTNGAEDTAGTNPLSPNSVFRVTSVTPSSVTWSTVPGKKYQLEVSGAPNGTYDPVGGVVTAGPAEFGHTQSVTVTPPAFYRVRIVP